MEGLKTNASLVVEVIYVLMGKLKNQCKDCGGASICSYGRQRSGCKDCSYIPKAKPKKVMVSKEKVKKISKKSSNQKYICQHGKYKYNCKNCKNIIIDKQPITENEEVPENSNLNFRMDEVPEKVLTFGNKNSAFQKYMKSTHGKIFKQKSAFQLWRKLI